METRPLYRKTVEHREAVHNLLILENNSREELFVETLRSSNQCEFLEENRDA